MLTVHEQNSFKKYVDTLDVDRVSVAFNALGEPNRCTIFRALLKQSDASVGQLASATELSESLTSQHLKVLRNAGLIERIKQGKCTYYKVLLNDPIVAALKEVVET